MAIQKTGRTRSVVVDLAVWVKLLPIESAAMNDGVSLNPMDAAERDAIAYGLKIRTLGKVTLLGIDDISRK